MLIIWPLLRKGERFPLRTSLHFWDAILLGENCVLSWHSLHNHRTTSLILVNPPDNRGNPEKCWNMGSSLPGNILCQAVGKSWNAAVEACWTLLASSTSPSWRHSLPSFPANILAWLCPPFIPIYDCVWLLYKSETNLQKFAWFIHRLLQSFIHLSKPSWLHLSVRSLSDFAQK